MKQQIKNITNKRYIEVSRWRANRKIIIKMMKKICEKKHIKRFKKRTCLHEKYCKLCSGDAKIRFANYKNIKISKMLQYEKEREFLRWLIKREWWRDKVKIKEHLRDPYVIKGKTLLKNKQMFTLS